jgi:hypothetical protein
MQVVVVAVTKTTINFLLKADSAAEEPVRVMHPHDWQIRILVAVAAVIRQMVTHMDPAVQV